MQCRAALDGAPGVVLHTRGEMGHLWDKWDMSRGVILARKLESPLGTCSAR